MVVLLLALTVFVACGDPETTTAETTTTKTETTTTAAKPADTTAEKPADTTAEKPADTTAEKPVDPNAKPVADEDSVDLLATEGLLGEMVIEDHHGFNNNQPAFVFYIDADEAGTCLEILGSGYPDAENWSNPKYEWVLYVGGKKVIPAKFSVYDGFVASQGWAYFRADLGPTTNYEYVDNKFDYAIELFILDATTKKVAYFANFAEKFGSYKHEIKVEVPAQNVTLPEGLADAAVKADSITAEGIEVWGDSSAAKLFDGDAVGSKIGGGTNKADVTVLFSTVKETTATYYTIVTGGDSAEWTGRNPLGWTLYGKVGEEWVVLSEITGTGLEDVNSTPYSYQIEEPKACTEYKIVFKTGDSMQLNEMKLHYVPTDDEDPDAEKDERSQYLTVGQMKEITANGTGFQLQPHVGPSINAEGVFYIGISSAGNPFAGGTVAGTHGIGNTTLVSVYLNGEKIDVTEGMYSTKDHWEIFVNLDPEKLQDSNELILAIEAKDMENNNCNFDNYYVIATFAKPQ